MIRFLLFLGGFAVSCPQTYADCFDDAAAWQGVHAGVLRAISLQENRRCDATVVRNRNGSSDMGCMQVNSVHLPELLKYGITKEGLLDPCTNIYVGARHYKKMVVKYGNTWTAVGAYHSEIPQRRDAYAKSVEALFRRYHLNRTSPDD